MSTNDPTIDSPSTDKSTDLRRTSIWRSVRDWTKVHRWKTRVTAALVIVGVALAFTGWLDPTYHGDSPVTLEMALKALDDGIYLQAKQLAEQMRQHETFPPEQLGEPAFVLGAATALEAGEGWNRNKRNAYLLASRYMEEARDRGFPPARRAQGLYLLGLSLFESGHYTTCRPHLFEAAQEDPARATEVHRLLSEAYLREANPQFAKALSENKRYLADRRLSSAERAEGLLRQSEILFGLGQLAECRTTLGQIPDNAATNADTVLMRGRLLLSEARVLKQTVLDPPDATTPRVDAVRQALEKYHQAIEAFDQAELRDSIGNVATRKAMYLRGVCYFEMGELDPPSLRSAQSQLRRTRKLYFDSPEGFAASLLEGDLERSIGRGAEAVAAYRRTMASVDNPQMYSNPWLPLDVLRQRIMTAYRYFVEQNQFETATQLLAGFIPLFDNNHTLELSAQTAHAWGKSLLANADALVEVQAESARRAARKKFRRAGYLYAVLAKKRITSRSYPDELWNSAQNMLLGHDFTSARNLLTEYLRNEARQRRPLALVSLGKAHLALGANEQAIQALRECIEFFPRDAASYEAKLWCSRAYLESARMNEAEALLAENLTSDTLTPASREWRESLFLLGQLLHEHGRLLHEQDQLAAAEKKHLAAIEKLEEAVARYPDASQAIEAHYAIAESYRLAATDPMNRYDDPATIESARRTFGRRIRELLHKAHQHYTLLQQKLNWQQEEVNLSELDQVILRNCYMSIGATLSDLGKYESPRRYQDAIKAYSDASTRYQNEPIVLEAYLQIANCYRRLNRSIIARGAVHQAKEVLNHLKTGKSFEITTNYSREEWQQLLEQQSVW